MAKVASIKATTKRATTESGVAEETIGSTIRRSDYPLPQSGERVAVVAGPPCFS